MMWRLLRYVVFCFFVLLTVALAAATVRSFWAIDSVYYYVGVPQKPAAGWPFSTVIRYTWNRGTFYTHIDNECGPRHAREILFKAADRPPRFDTPTGKPTASHNYGMFTHARLEGIPGISSSMDPSLVRLLAERYAVPLWWPLGASAAACLALFFWARRAWRVAGRRRLGLCLRCGYDLRAHQPGARCPECGTVKAASADSRRTET